MEKQNQFVKLPQILENNKCHIGNHLFEIDGAPLRNIKLLKYKSH